MASDYTKNTKRLYWFYKVVDWLLLFAPVIVYIVAALVAGDVTTTGKVSVIGSVSIAAILVIFNVIAQKHLRCPIWIILLGLFVAMQEHLLPLIVMLAITSVLDEFFLTPIVAYYKTKLISSKTFDERLSG